MTMMKCIHAQRESDLTFKHKSLHTWSYSLHDCNDIVMEEDNVRYDGKRIQSHPEEKWNNPMAYQWKNAGPSLIAFRKDITQHLKTCDADKVFNR